jgi:hypothetical protein
MNYKVLKVALVSLGAVPHTALGKSYKHIGEAMAKYGPQVWPVAYQSDTRMRQERMPDIKIEGMMAHSEAAVSGRSHPYDPKRPWDWVWKQAVLDDKFWRKELDEPAMFVLTKLQTMSSVIDGDLLVDKNDESAMPWAPVFSGADVPHSGGGHPHNAPSLGNDGRVAPGGRVAQAKKRARNESTAPKNVVGHPKVEGGVYVTNVKGRKLCAGFQAGRCAQCRAGSASYPTNNGETHQCKLCLLPGHGGAACTNVATATTRQPFAGFTKGSGKGGRGGGRGGRGGRGG